MDAAAEVCRAYGEAAQAGLEAGLDTESVLAAAFSARRGVTIGRPPGSTPLSRLALQVILRGMRPWTTPGWRSRLVPRGYSRGGGVPRRRFSQSR